MQGIIPATTSLLSLVVLICAMLTPGARTQEGPIRLKNLLRRANAELSARGVGAPMRARLMAAAFLTALRVAVQAYPDRTGGAPLIAVMQESLAETGKGFLCA